MTHHKCYCTQEGADALAIFRRMVSKPDAGIVPDGWDEGGQECLECGKEFPGSKYYHVDVGRKHPKLPFYSRATFLSKQIYIHALDCDIALARVALGLEAVL